MFTAFALLQFRYNKSTNANIIESLALVTKATFTDKVALVDYFLIPIKLAALSLNLFQQSL